MSEWGVGGLAALDIASLPEGSVGAVSALTSQIWGLGGESINPENTVNLYDYRKITLITIAQTPLLFTGDNQWQSCN